MTKQTNEMKLKERIKELEKIHETAVLQLLDLRDELEKKLAHYEDNCTIVWMIGDVEFCCREMNYNRPSKRERRDFLNYLERKHDATLGISWETIHIYLDMWEADEDWPIEIPNDTYYEELDEGDWGDHPLNNREVEYND